MILPKPARLKRMIRILTSTLESTIFFAIITKQLLKNCQLPFSSTSFSLSFITTKPLLFTWPDSMTNLSLSFLRLWRFTRLKTSKMHKWDNAGTIEETPCSISEESKRLYSLSEKQKITTLMKRCRLSFFIRKEEPMKVKMILQR